ncbi:MAG: hypothetical protein H7Y00_01315, partial [Fimbriimonadaceae bacterium]|nr:hypothetical protein [Chitinophagales bacterium]
MKQPLLTLIALASLCNFLTAQSTGDYRSVGSGPWESAATWESYDGIAWTSATVAPNGTNSNVITILNGDNIDNDSQNIQGDQIVVEDGGILFVAVGDLTILNGTGDDLVLNGDLNMGGGTLIVDGNLIVSATGHIECGSSDIFRGVGTIEIAPGGSINIFSTGADFVLGEGLSLNNNGQMNWSGAGDFIIQDANTAINNFANMDLSGDGNLDMTGTNNAVNNNSNLFFNYLVNFISSGGTNAALNNNVGGTILLANAITIGISSDVVFNNHGSVQIESVSTLDVANSNGVHDGTYDVDGTLSGAADVSFTGPTFSVSGTVSLTNLQFNGSTNQTLTGGGTIQNMQMYNSAGLTLGSDITVEGNMIFNAGIIDANGFTFICGAASSLAINSSSWVYGKLRHTFT